MHIEHELNKYMKDTNKPIHNMNKSIYRMRIKLYVQLKNCDKSLISCELTYNYKLTLSVLNINRNMYIGLYFMEKMKIHSLIFQVILFLYISIHVAIKALMLTTGSRRGKSIRNSD